MNILLITQFPPPNGGIASWSEAFLSEFSQEEDGLYRRGDTRIAAVNNAIIGQRSGQIHGKKSIMDEIKRTMRMIRDIRKTLKRLPIHCVHANITCAKLGLLRDVLALSCIPKKIPVCIHCHCSVPDQVEGSGLSRRLFRLLLNRSSLVMVLNQASKAYVDALITNLKDIRCEITPNPVEEKYIKPDHAHTPGGLKRIIYTGRFEPAKGALELLETAKRFPEVEFHLVGSVDERMAQEAFPANITAHGNMPREQVLAELDKADAFLFPSHAEGFSMSMLEAMSRGLPIAASDVGANREMLGASGGIIFEKGNISQMVDALRRLHDPAYRAACGQANARKVQAEYTTCAVAEKITGLYHTISD